MQNRKSAVVLVIDRLGAGHLGPYGNTSLDTPGFNQLAAESLVCQHTVSDSPTLAAALSAWWQGRHALEPALVGEAALRAVGLPALAASSRLATHLVSDEPLVYGHPAAKGFSRVRALKTTETLAACETPEQTGLARLLAEGIRVLDAQREPFLLWIHARGLAGGWDAPYSLRENLTDEDDPAPPQFIAPPALQFEGEIDPDDLFGLNVAYAAQVQIIDMGVAALLDALTETRLRNDVLLAVTSPRGFPLGEHGAIGDGSNDLYGELLHVPLFLRFPDQAAASRRTMQLVQPPDLCATLAEWLGIELAPPRFAKSLVPLASPVAENLRPCAVAALSQQRALRTSQWLLRCPKNPPMADADGAAAPCNLFAKPDDFWEVNDVADRCPQVVEELVEQLTACEKSLQLPTGES